VVSFERIFKEEKRGEFPSKKFILVVNLFIISDLFKRGEYFDIFVLKNFSPLFVVKTF
jgi:hypothetical protein